MSNIATRVMSLRIKIGTTDDIELSESFDEAIGGHFGYFTQTISTPAEPPDLPADVTAFNLVYIYNVGAFDVYVGHNSTKADMLIKVCAGGAPQCIRLNDADLTTFYMLAPDGDSDVRLLIPKSS